MIFGDAIRTDGLNLSITQVMGFDEWTEALEIVSHLEVATSWWIGDLLNLGERQFGELYAQGIPERLQPGTLKQYQWVSERICPENRREDLSWTHHRAVAALEPSEQAEMLDQAVSEGWSVAELTRRVKGQEEPTEEKSEAVGVATGRRTNDEGREVVEIELDGEWPAWLAVDMRVLVRPA